MPGPESSIPTTHALRNRFNVLTLRLHLLRRQLETDAVQDADASIAAALNGLAELEQDVAKLRPTWPLRPQAPAPRALLVEDNPNESELLAGYLRSCNFEVATASNGADALAYLARNEHPDVVLLDMNMPRMDGCATVRELRRNPATAGLKIVAVTGRTREEVGLDRCHQAFNRWFTKPIRPDVLVRELQSELGIVTSA
jgi:CheY-like chemotaxis protein